MSKNDDIESLSLLGLGLTGLGLLGSVFIVLTTNSLVVVADLCNSTLEFAADLLAYVTFRLLRSNRFALLEYGLGKFENVASLFIGLLMILSVLLLAVIALDRMADPVELAGTGTWLGLVFSGVFGLLNARLWRQSGVQLKKNPSPIVDTQHRLFATKTIMDLVVFITFSLSLTLHFGWVHYVDTVASLVIGGFMIAAAWRMIRHSLRDLVDHTVNESLQMTINQHLVRHFDAYSMLDKVRSRCSGGDIFVEIFLAFDSRLRIGEIQPVIDALRDGLEREIRNARVTVISRALVAD